MKAKLKAKTFYTLVVIAYCLVLAFICIALDLNDKQSTGLYVGVTMIIGGLYTVKHPYSIWMILKPGYLIAAT